MIVVMAPKRMMKRMKRMLEQCTAENYESGETIEQGGRKSNRDFFREDHFARVNSKRWKTGGYIFCVVKHTCI